MPTQTSFLNLVPKGSAIVSVMGDRKVNEKSDRKAGKKAAPQNDGWKGFVNVELNEVDKAQVRALVNDMNAVWYVVWDLVDRGYKLTISFDASHDVYNCSMTCRADREPNQGLTLSGRGGTVQAAVASFVFKHQTLLGGSWSQAFDGGGRASGPDFVG